MGMRGGKRRGNRLSQVGGLGEGGADAEFAAAVLLVVEGVGLEELVAAVLEAVFAPVLCPEEGGEGGETALRMRNRGERVGETAFRMGNGGGRGGETALRRSGGDGLLGGESGLGDLVEAFPAGGGEGGGEVGDAELLGLEGGGGEADAEALEAAGAAFGFVF